MQYVTQNTQVESEYLLKIYFSKCTFFFYCRKHLSHISTFKREELPGSVFSSLFVDQTSCPAISLCCGITLTKGCCVVVLPSSCGSCLSCVALRWPLDLSTTGPNAPERTGPLPGQSVSRLASSLANIFELPEPELAHAHTAEVALGQFHMLHWVLSSPRFRIATNYQSMQNLDYPLA